MQQPIPVRNPRTGQPDYSITPPSPQALSAAVEAMRHAQPAWAEAGVAHRIAALEAWAAALEGAMDQLVEALVQDTGRHNESVLEARWLLPNLRRWQQWALHFFSDPPDKASAVPHIRIRQAYIPYPVVAVISPWNFPLLLSLIDTIPALLAGCAVVVKPSEITPRFAEVIAATIQATPGLAPVFRYVTGAGETGSQLVALADLCCFTGSVATGRKVYQQAAALFKPCFLELGGKDAALVFEGADLEHAARSILWGSTVNCGHSCLSIERVYVQSSVFEAFRDILVAEAAALKLAYPQPQDGQIGPVISERQVDIINAHLADALAKGATLETGNAACVPLGGGWYCRPTVLTGVHHGMLVMQEETFGPIIPLAPFHDAEEALRLANDTPFGLSGAVFAADNDTAIRHAAKMEAGAISINECALTALVHDGEKTSFKMSGLGGSRMGPASLQRFMRKKALLINENPNPSPWWY